MWHLCAAMMSWVCCFLTYLVLPNTWKWRYVLGITEISANKTKSSESFSKEPTQLIISAHNCHTDSKITILKCISFPKTKKWSSKNGVKHIQTAGYNSAHMVYLEYSVKVRNFLQKANSRVYIWKSLHDT